MALKITSGGWNAAAVENQVARDLLRESFFSQAGVRPAASIREVFLPPATRIQRTLALIDQAGSPRIDDPSLADAARMAMQALATVGLGVPALPSLTESRPLGLSALAPEVLVSFFDVDTETTLGRSLF